jgi:nucleoside-diphosphate-sugar epimerase
MELKYLVTGASSGLGRYLVEELPGAPFRREAPGEIERHKESKYDCIIHCATDARKSLNADELWNYHRSHISLTDQLTQIPHHLFVYISSAEIYPDPSRLNGESDRIELPETPYLYGLFKLLAEQVVRNRVQSFLILRCTSIVGRTSRQNNIVRILRGRSDRLSLRADSLYNLVGMSQIAGLIRKALAENITGIFNIGASQNAFLGDIAAHLGVHPEFGDHLYKVPLMNTRKIQEVSQEFRKNSLDVAREIADEFQRRQAPPAQSCP